MKKKIYIIMSILILTGTCHAIPVAPDEEKEENWKKEKHGNQEESGNRTGETGNGGTREGDREGQRDREAAGGDRGAEGPTGGEEAGGPEHGKRLRPGTPGGGGSHRGRRGPVDGGDRRAGAAQGKERGSLVLAEREREDGTDPEQRPLPEDEAAVCLRAGGHTGGAAALHRLPGQPGSFRSGNEPAQVRRGERSTGGE